MPDMQYVCDDVSHGIWYYSPNEKRYYRKDGDNITAKIHGKYLPDPNGFAQYHGRPMGEVATKLWRHWNAE